MAAGAFPALEPLPQDDDRAALGQVGGFLGFVAETGLSASERVQAAAGLRVAAMRLLSIAEAWAGSAAPEADPKTIGLALRLLRLVQGARITAQCDSACALCGCWCGDRPSGHYAGCLGLEIEHLPRISLAQRFLDRPPSEWVAVWPLCSGDAAEEAGEDAGWGEDTSILLAGATLHFVGTEAVVCFPDHSRVALQTDGGTEQPAILSAALAPA